LYFVLWLNDNEIICNVGLGCESESIDQGRSYVDKNINISNCFFSRSSSYSGHGGVIYVNVGSYSMNVNYSMFYNCFCSSWGGAIYFDSSNSYLRMICANSCSCGASYSGHFAYLLASQVNQVAEEGTHEQLLENHGIYAQNWSEQVRAKEWKF